LMLRLLVVRSSVTVVMMASSYDVGCNSWLRLLPVSDVIVDCCGGDVKVEHKLFGEDIVGE